MSTDVSVELCPFLTSAVDEDEWSFSYPGRFIPEERISSTNWIGDWVAVRSVWKL
jgi:hypothetical protein